MIKTSIWSSLIHQGPTPRASLVILSHIPIISAWIAISGSCLTWAHDRLVWHLVVRMISLYDHYGWPQPRTTIKQHNLPSIFVAPHHHTLINDVSLRMPSALGLHVCTWSQKGKTKREKPNKEIKLVFKSRSQSLIILSSAFLVIVMTEA